jgi:hypothetical protein
MMVLEWVHMKRNDQSIYHDNAQAWWDGSKWGLWDAINARTCFSGCRQ